MPQDPSIPTTPQVSTQPPEPTPASSPLPDQPRAPFPTPPTTTPPAPNPIVAEQVPPEPSIVHPQTTPPAQTESSQTTPPTPPQNLGSSHKSKAALILVLAFLLLTPILLFTGGIGLAYNNYALFTPPQAIKDLLDNTISISPLPKPTRLIIESTFVKTASIKSADIKTELSMTTSSDSSPIEGVKLTLEGPTEFDKPESKASEIDIGLEVKFEGATFNGAASVKAVEDRIYFKINEFPFGQMYQQLLSYKDKWYYWDIPEEYKTKDEDKEISENVNKLLSEFVKKSQSWTTITNKDGALYEMEIKPPKEEITDLIYDIIQVYEPKDQEKILTSLEKEKITKGMEKVNDLKITMKVNKDTYYLQNINTQFNLAIDDFSLPTQTESLLPQDQVVFNFNLSAELSNYNRQVVVIPPPDAINIETTIQELSKTYGSSLQPPESESPTPTPSPEPLPTDDELAPEATEEGDLEDDDLHSLISPEETILGEKYNWEQELFKLFTSIVK